MKQITRCAIIEKPTDTTGEPTGIIFYVPSAQRQKLITIVEEALKKEDDLMVDDIEGDTILIPFTNLYYSQRIVFTDVEEVDPVA